MRFTDKVAVITAFANGIGRATAEIMAREGAIVVGVDNHPDRLETAVAALRGAGGRAHGRLCDALDQGQVEGTIASVGKEFGAVDILVNAVGGSTIIANSGAQVDELTFAEWQRLIDFNLRACESFAQFCSIKRLQQVVVVLLRGADDWSEGAGRCRAIASCLRSCRSSLCRKRRVAERRACGSRSAISWAGRWWQLTIWWRAIIRCGRYGRLSRGSICVHYTMR